MIITVIYSCFEKGCLTNGKKLTRQLIEPQSFSAWLKETAQTHMYFFFLVPCCVAINHLEPSLEPQSSKPKLLLPIMPIDIVAYAFTLLWDNPYFIRYYNQWLKTKG